LVHDEIVERIELTMESWVVGDPFAESTDFGPLIDADHAKEVDKLVDEAVDAGAELVCGGQRDGAFYEPTLLANVPQDARIISEEQFGPVAAVTTFADEDEAIELANASDLALDASVFTSDHNRALRLATGSTPVGSGSMARPLTESAIFPPAATTLRGSTATVST